MWTFWLDGNEVAEPQKWDSVQFTFRRSDALGGVELVFSDSLEFTGEGAKYLQSKFNAEGIDAKVNIRIEGSTDCEGVAYTYNGRINFALYKENNGCPDCLPDSVTVGLVQSGLTSRFKNRLDVPVNLDSLVGIDGLTMPIAPYRAALLHSREVTFRSNYVINEALTRWQMVFELNRSQKNVTPPFQTVGGEVDQTMEPTSFGTSPAGSFGEPLFYSGFTFPAGVTVRSLPTKGRVRFAVNYFSVNGAVINLKFRLKLTVRGVQSQAITSDFLLGEQTVSPGTTTLEYPFEVTANFPTDSNLFLYLEIVRVGSPGVLVGSVDFIRDGSFLEYREDSVYAPSSARGLLVHEAFERITESITGEPDSFRSDFFTNTCQKWNLLTNGLAIRQAKTAEGLDYPLSASFEALYNGLDAIFCLGRRVEVEGVPTDVLLDASFCTSPFDNTKYAPLPLSANYYEIKLTGSIAPNLLVKLALLRAGEVVWEESVSTLDPRLYRVPLRESVDQFRLVSNVEGCFGVTVQGIQHEVVRVEPREYFYRNETALSLDGVSDVDRSVDLQSIVNEFEVGYSKWESGLVGGVDEIQTKRSYVLPIENAKRKISAISNLITGGYLIELQRRKQFEQTKDAANDNDLFLIALNKSALQSKRYSRDGMNQNHPTGTVSERNEEFVDVTGMQSPETAYNLRLSPVRMAHNWRRVLATSTVRKVNPVLRFQTGTGNVKESDLLPDSCGGLVTRVSQDMNVPLNVTPLFEPEIFSFSAPLSLTEFLELQQNAIFAVAFRCEDDFARGYIREVSYEPNADGGTANFSLLKAPN